MQIAGLGDSLGDLAEQARAAEAAGIDCVWAVELFRSSLTQAMWLASSTETIGVGTGIAWGFTRSPMILALSALDIDEASGGRFRLGLGAGVKRLNETWHGVEYGRPAPHLRETVEAVRLIIESAGGASRSATRAPTTTSTSRAGSARTPRSANRSRSTPPPCSRGWRGWPATSPTG